MDQSSASTLGKRIAAHRKRLGLTQDQLAERLGVSPQAVSKWENDLSCPDISTLPKLADIFGVSTDALLGVPTREEPVHQGEILQDGEEDDSKEPQGLHFDNGKFSFVYDGTPGKRTAISFALWIVGMGLMLLAGRLLKTHMSLWTAAWTMGLLALGVNCLLTKFNFFGVALSLSGVYFILDALDVFSIRAFTWGIVLPCLLIVWGVCLLIDAFTKKSCYFHGKHRHGQFGESASSTENGVFQYSDSFGEGRYTVNTPELQRGEVNVSFGEHTIDLTGCQSVAPDCKIVVSASFGELTFLVPRRFQVRAEGSKNFSAIHLHGQPDTVPAGTIFMDINTSFGEVNIQYV